jgi:hypothetical protein
MVGKHAEASKWLQLQPGVEKVGWVQAQAFITIFSWEVASVHTRNTSRSQWPKDLQLGPTSKGSTTSQQPHSGDHTFSLEPLKTQHLPVHWYLSETLHLVLGTSIHGVHMSVLTLPRGVLKVSPGFCLFLDFWKDPVRRRALWSWRTFTSAPCVSSQAPSKPAGSLLSDPSHLPSLQITTRTGSQELDPCITVLIEEQTELPASRTWRLKPEKQWAYPKKVIFYVCFYKQLLSVEAIYFFLLLFYL